MVKEKPNSTRMYDQDGYRRRAACICVRNEAENEILLVTSSRRPEHWIVPGGGVEPEEEPAATALREVAEEAGVLGKLGRSLGVFENDDRKHRTQDRSRQRKWFTLDEALKLLRLHKPYQLRYLESMLRPPPASPTPS
ncbi:hypothetical protein M8J76_005604 [Diaphorina citri]|nr:hypothetical protein M8J76_005604 [Diaphorina citri]